MALVQPHAQAAPKRITILGSTGSVGCSTIDLIERNPDAFVVEALTAFDNVDLLAQQAIKLNARFAVVADPGKFEALQSALAGTETVAGAGAGALIEAAERPSDLVMAAIVGAAGLAPTLAAVRRGSAIALANKECLVCAGDLMIKEVRARGAVLLPVDSEHNAIFQVFDFERSDSVEKIILTASGGPFLSASRDVMAQATPAQAVNHPNWSMGAKISVDSATMMNKGLELIEAFHLFPVPEDRIDIVIHPQSVVHSLVSYVDGSVLAQMGTPDMRTPISFALAWPERIATPAERLDLAAMGNLTFESPDPGRFPALGLARAALQSGGAGPTILNAANEMAVTAFLNTKIGFLDITRVVEETLEQVPNRPLARLEDVHEADREARATAGAQIDAILQ